MKSIADKGNLRKERLIIQVVNDTDVGEFTILQPAYVDDEVNIGGHNTYRFPNWPIKAGDLVALCSKVGKDKVRPMERGGQSHFFYWGLSTSVWSRPKISALLAHAFFWESASALEL